MIYSINFLRFVAASLVVTLHVIMQFNGKVSSNFSIDLFGFDITSLGSAGVDIFFMISGFVIYISNESRAKTFKSFIGARLLRVLPLYYLYTICYLLLASFVPSDYTFDLFNFISSLVLIPSPNADGLYAPVLYVGWSLSYELYFYLIFSLFYIRFNLGIYGIASALIFPVLMYFFCSSREGFLQTKDIIFNPLLMEFIAGMLVARFRFYLLNKNKSLSLLLFVLAILLYISGNNHHGDYYRFIYYGFPSLLLFISIFILELDLFKHKFFVLLGDSSYSLYLSHILSLPLVFKLISFFNVKYFGVYWVLSVVFCQGIAVFSYLYVESFLDRFYKNSATLVRNCFALIK